MTLTTLRVLLSAVAALVVVEVAATQNPPPITAADWPMYNYDVAGWRFNPAEGTLGPENVGKLVEKWRFPAAGAKERIGVVHATPTVVAGEVYFGTATFPTFYKLAPDGTLLWVHSFGLPGEDEVSQMGEGNNGKR